MYKNINMLQENIINVKGTQKEKPRLIIKFNSSVFTYHSVEDSCIEKNKSVEILPSIYCSIKKRWNNDFMEQYYSRYINSNNFVSRLFSLVVVAINQHKYDNQDIEVILEIKNKRDNIEIIEELDDNRKILYSNKKENFHKKLLKDKYSNSYNTTKSKGMFIDTDKILYPSSMGGGANGCIIWNIFQILDLMSTFKYDYKVYDVESMLEGSSYNERLLELCSKSENCGSLLKKFRNNTYDISELTLHDNIELLEYKGYYIPIEGKHRVCLVKRFKIPKVYAEVMSCIDIKEKPKDNFLKNHPPFYRFTAEEILLAYYDIFRKIGLEEDNIRFIAEGGLSDAEIIEYIEKITKKTLLEIAVEMQKIKVIMY